MLPPISTPRSLLVPLATALLVVLGLLSPGRAAAREPVELALSAPAGFAGTDATLTLTLTDAGAPVAEAPVRVERRVAGTWTPVASLTTGADGTASTTLTRSSDPAENQVRAFFDGDADHPAASGTLTLPLQRRTGVVTLRGQIGRAHV